MAITRRSLLLGASALTLGMVAPLSSIQATTARNPALDVLVDVVQNFLRRVEARESSPYLSRLQRMSLEWSGVNLEEKILDCLKTIYSDPEFDELKERHGSILEDSGRMRITAQLKFSRDFPACWDYAGNPEVFRAFASFAPKHLL